MKTALIAVVFALSMVTQAGCPVFADRSYQRGLRSREKTEAAWQAEMQRLEARQCIRMRQAEKQRAADVPATLAAARRSEREVQSENNGIIGIPWTSFGP